ncbi:MAG: hypothetical protein AAF318_09800 [Pseudomonadota bacterium]
MDERDEEGDLDPAMERVRKKLARLLFFSTGIMVLGLLAVVAGIFYRVGQIEEAKQAEPVALPIRAADLVSATVADDSLVLRIGGDAPRIEVRDLPDGELVATFTLEP